MSHVSVSTNTSMLRADSAQNVPFTETKTRNGGSYTIAHLGAQASVHRGPKTSSALCEVLATVYVNLV